MVMKERLRVVGVDGEVGTCRRVTVRKSDQNAVYLGREGGGGVAGEQRDRALHAAGDVAAKYGAAAIKVPARSYLTCLPCLTCLRVQLAAAMRGGCSAGR